MGQRKTRGECGTGVGAQRPLECWSWWDTNTESFTSSKAKQTADRTWPGQIDTLMRFTDEKRGRGGDNSFPSQRFAKCILTCEVRPKPIYAPNHSWRITSVIRLTRGPKKTSQVLSDWPIHKSPLKEFSQMAIIKGRGRAKRLTSLLSSGHFIAMAVNWG